MDKKSGYIKNYEINNMPGSSKQLHHTFQGQKLTGAQSPLDFGLGYWTFTYNLVKHIDIFYQKSCLGYQLELSNFYPCFSQSINQHTCNTLSFEWFNDAVEYCSYVRGWRIIL